MDRDAELGRLRRAIDACNERIADSLQERARLTRAIGAWKSAHGVPAVDVEREAEMLAAARRAATPDAFDGEALGRIFASIFRESRALIDGGGGA